MNRDDRDHAPASRDRAGETAERKGHLRTLAATGALASLGAFAALAASATDPTSTQPATDLPATAQPADEATPPAAGGDDDAARSGPRTFDDPQGDFFDGSGSGGSVVPNQGSQPGSAPAQSGGS